MICRVGSLFVAALASWSAVFSQGYYPLQVGNRWDYGELDPPPPGHFSFLYSVRIVGDTIMPNGLKYAIRKSGPQADYLRQTGGTVFCFTDQGDRILYDFTVKDGDTVNVSYVPYDTIITTVRIGYGQVFNTTRKVWTYTHKPYHSTNEGWFTITDGIGYSYMFAEGGYSEYLIGAIINGVQYGIVSTVNTVENGAPGAFLLTQNYPNPFNLTTVVSYSVPPMAGRDLVSTDGRDGQLPVASDVRLIVYDVLGREVSVLVNERKEQGSYSVQFNAGGLASGVYFCRMKAGGFMQTKRVVLLK